MMQAFKLSTAADNASCDGAIFVLASGDVQVATDTAGSGHRWRLIDDHPWRHCYVMLAREAWRGGRPRAQRLRRSRLGGIGRRADRIA